MKKISMLMFAFVLFLVSACVSYASTPELSVGASYSKSLLTGASKKMNERIDFVSFDKINKLSDWELGKGLSVQYNEKTDTTLFSPSLYLRYYPFNNITPFVEVYGGVPLNFDTQDFGYKAGVGLGIGREAVVAKLYVDFTDGKVMDMKGDVLNTGVMLGYRFK